MTKDAAERRSSNPARIAVANITAKPVSMPDTMFGNGALSLSLVR
jgi:hypothetical protein